MTERDIETDRLNRIEAKMENYLHAARRMIVNNFGTEPANDAIQVSVTLAAAMAHIEMAEVIAASQDHIAEIMEQREV